MFDIWFIRIVHNFFSPLVSSCVDISSVEVDLSFIPFAFLDDSNFLIFVVVLLDMVGKEYEECRACI